MLKISTLNCNGIRAANRKGFTKWVEQTDPDIICLQELRAQEHQVPDDIQGLPYHKYYHSAEKKGYSGVAIFSKKEPEFLQLGTGVEWIDKEGRVLMAEFEGFCVCSLYAPSGTTGSERQALKMEFLDIFLAYARGYFKGQKPVLLCGDFNICHHTIDIHHPKQHKKSSGFLPEERAWVTELLTIGFKDIYREMHPGEPDLYSWWSYRAASKERNMGWRIDYHIASPEMLNRATEAIVQKKWDMSDHAPVTITYQS